MAWLGGKKKERKEGKKRKEWLDTMGCLACYGDWRATFLETNLSHMLFLQINSCI